MATSQVETTLTANKALAEVLKGGMFSPMYFMPGVAANESAYLAQIMALRSSEMWMYTLEKGFKLEHDLIMGMLGFAPAEHVAPLDKMSRANNNGWFAALDKGLAAVGE